MSDVVGKWKSYNKRKYRIIWQEGYFDHRIQNDAVFDENQRI